MEAVNHDEHKCADPNHRDAHGNHLPRPPYHPTIAQVIDEEGTSDTSLEGDSRDDYRTSFKRVNDLLFKAARDVIPVLRILHTVKKGTFAGLRFSYFAAKTSPTPGALRPCIFYINPAGPCAGDSHFAINQTLMWVVQLNLICISVEYSLAPDAVYPAAVNECHAVLRIITRPEWRPSSKSTSSICIDPTNICIVSGSGGAAIAAGLVLKARDETVKRKVTNKPIPSSNVADNGSAPSTDLSKKRKLDNGTNDESTAPTKKQKTAEEGAGRALQSADAVQGALNIKGMLLYSPMLHYKLDGISAAQFRNDALGDVGVNDRLWSMYFTGTYEDSAKFSERRQYEKLAPGLRDDLCDMPSTFLEVGACETSRSETVKFAEQLWRCGCDYELHVWAGGCANFPLWFRDLSISKSAIEARQKWLERTLCGLA